MSIHDRARQSYLQMNNTRRVSVLAGRMERLVISMSVPSLG